MARHVSQAEAIDEIARKAAEGGERTIFVGIDGPGGAGKSTFAMRAAASVARAVVVSIDDFAAPNISEWDWERFRAQVLTPLRAGRPARYQRWDWDLDVGAEWQDVPTGRLVLVEGVSSTRREVGAPWALTVWVDTPRDTRLARAIERDGSARLGRWLNDWMPSEDAYIARENPVLRMDLVVSGTEPT